MFNTIKIIFTKIVPFLALKIRPKRCASWRREPPWEDIWIKTLASGKSNEVSATLLTNIVFTLVLNLKFCKICMRSLWNYLHRYVSGDRYDVLFFYFTYLTGGAIDVWFVHFNGIVLQGKDIIWENNGFIATSFVIPYQILTATKFVRIHYIK